MAKTEKHGFGGGNTDWEESRLGSYSKRYRDLLVNFDGIFLSSNEIKVAQGSV